MVRFVVYDVTVLEQSVSGRSDVKINKILEINHYVYELPHKLVLKNYRAAFIQFCENNQLWNGQRYGEQIKYIKELYNYGSILEAEYERILNRVLKNAWQDITKYEYQDREQTIKKYENADALLNFLDYIGHRAVLITYTSLEQMNENEYREGEGQFLVWGSKEHQKRCYESSFKNSFEEVRTYGNEHTVPE